MRLSEIFWSWKFSAYNFAKANFSPTNYQMIYVLINEDNIKNNGIVFLILFHKPSDIYTLLRYSQLE